MTDKSSSGADSASPWSGEVPIPTAPVEFTWATADDTSEGSSWAGAPDRSSASIPQSSQSSQSSQRVGSDADSGGNPNLNLNRVVAGIGAVLLLVVGWLAVGRNDDSTEIAADDSVPVRTEVDDSLPTVDEPADTEPDAADDPNDDGDGADGSGSGESNGDDADIPEWREDTMELPQFLLDSTVPFDVVALTSEGEYIEVGVPSGRVDLVEVGRAIDGRVLAGETSTLFVNFSSTQGGRLLRAGEPPLELSLPSNIDISQVGVDGDEFAGVSYGNNGEISLVRVLADGAVVTTSDDDIEQNFWQRRFTPDGSTVVSEAGGVYVGGDDGFERVSTGLLISASTNQMLVRECDDVMLCGYFTIAFDSGERVAAAITDDGFGRFGFDSAEVSPDGRWLRCITYDNESSNEVLINLTTGDKTTLDFDNVGSDTGVWAPDSSGFFRRTRSPGFEFFAVETGETITFGEEFGRVISFDIREAPGRAAPSLRSPSTTALSLIALTESGDVAQIDVDSGAVVTTDGPGLDSSAPVPIFTDAAGATITSFDDVSSVRFIARDRMALEIEAFGPGGQVWPGPESGTVWQAGEGTNLETLEFELVDAQGTDLDGRIEFDGVGLNGIVGSDGNGGIVVQPPLGGVFVVDRATGERTLTANTGFTRAGDIASRGVPSGQNVSPDDTIAFVRGGDDPSRCLMIDTTASSEAWTGVPCVDFASPIVWTPDSGYAIWLDQGRVTVYERSTRSVRVLNTAELRAIAVVAQPAPPIDAAPPADTVTPVDAAAPVDAVAPGDE